MWTIKTALCENVETCWVEWKNKTREKGMYGCEGFGENVLEEEAFKDETFATLCLIQFYQDRAKLTVEGGRDSNEAIKAFSSTSYANDSISMKTSVWEGAKCMYTYKFNESILAEMFAFISLFIGQLKYV